MRQFQGDGRHDLEGDYSLTITCLALCFEYCALILTCVSIEQVGFKIFLNITPTITNWTSDNKQFSLVFDENPLADFVELPDDGRAQDELWFSNILCGVLRGSLEMVRAWPQLGTDDRRVTGFANIMVDYRSKCRWRLILSVIFSGAMTRQRSGYRLSDISRTRCRQTTSKTSRTSNAVRF